MIFSEFVNNLFFLIFFSVGAVLAIEFWIKFRDYVDEKRIKKYRKM